MAAEVRACEPTLPAAAAAALIAYVLIAAGSSMGGEILLLLGVPLTVAGFVMAGSAVLETRRAARERPFRWMYTALSALAAIGFITPSPRGGAFWYDVAYRVYPLLGLVTVGVFAAGTRTQQRFAVRTAVTAAVALCLLTPIGVPQPQIDVWSWTQ